MFSKSTTLFDLLWCQWYEMVTFWSMNTTSICDSFNSVALKVVVPASATRVLVISFDFSSNEWYNLRHWLGRDSLCKKHVLFSSMVMVCVYILYFSIPCMYDVHNNPPRGKCKIYVHSILSFFNKLVSLYFVIIYAKGNISPCFSFYYSHRFTTTYYY